VIVVDTSALTPALMAILLDEPAAEPVSRVPAGSDRIIISSATLAEALIVARAKDFPDERDTLIRGLGVEVMDFTAEGTRRAGRAFSRLGKGRRQASLNFGDCFSYACAQELGVPLLFEGSGLCIDGH